jgi:hypothetical protein
MVHLYNTLLAWHAAALSFGTKYNLTFSSSTNVGQVGSSSSLLSTFTRSPSSCSKISSISSAIGLNRVFHLRLLHLIDLGYKLRFRLPFFISSAFVACHLISNYVPRVEINVQVVEEDEEVDEDGHVLEPGVALAAEIVLVDDDDDYQELADDEESEEIESESESDDDNEDVIVRRA